MSEFLPPPGPLLGVDATPAWAAGPGTAPPVRSRILPWVLGGAAAVGLTVVIGLGFFVGSAVSSTGTAQRVWSGDLEVGDCFSETALAGTLVDLVPCAEPHEEEAYAVSLLPDGDFPGDAVVDAESQRRCEAAFAGYVGLPRDETALEYSSHGPSRESWDLDADRKVVCTVYDPGTAATSGSLRGSQH